MKEVVGNDTRGMSLAISHQHLVTKRTFASDDDAGTIDEVDLDSDK